MGSIVVDLVTALENTAAVAALVGARIYPLTLPQKVTLPAIRYQLIDSPLDMSHSGPTDLVHPRIQLSVHAATHLAASQVIWALKTALHGRTIVGGPSFVEEGPEDYEPETQQFMQHLDVIIWREDADG